MPNVAAPFLGFAVLLTLAAMGWAVWVYVTTSDGEAQRLPKKGRIVYKAGQWILLVAIVVALGLAAWAVGNALIGAI